MLLCQDEPASPIYVKIGLSDSPLKRMQSLRNGCPVTPKRFAICAVPSRLIAQRVERSLLTEFSPWTSHGEWFKFDKAEKQDFNVAWQRGFANIRLGSWALEWTHFAVEELIKQWAKSQKIYQSKWRRRGVAYQDFARDCKT